MTNQREDAQETRARLLYMQLRAGGWNLTREQYLTCKGWLNAGQYDRAERFMEKHGLLVGSRA